MSNATGNASRARVMSGSVEAYDEARAKLSPAMKKFVDDNDPGGFSMVQILDLVNQYGEHVAMRLVVIYRNQLTLEKYGPRHPQYDPRLPRVPTRKR